MKKTWINKDTKIKVNRRRLAIATALPTSSSNRLLQVEPRGKRFRIESLLLPPPGYKSLEIYVSGTCLSEIFWFSYIFQLCEAPCHQRQWPTMLPTRQVSAPWTLQVYSLGLSIPSWSEIWRGGNLLKIRQNRGLLCFIRALPSFSALMTEMPGLLWQERMAEWLLARF